MSFDIAISKTICIYVTHWMIGVLHCNTARAAICLISKLGWSQEELACHGCPSTPRRFACWSVSFFVIATYTGFWIRVTQQSNFMQTLFGRKQSELFSFGNMWEIIYQLLALQCLDKVALLSPLQLQPTVFWHEMKTWFVDKRGIKYPPLRNIFHCISIFLFF